MKTYIFQVNVDFEKNSTQHCLFVLIEKFKETIDTGNEFGALLTDFSKAFNCLDNLLLVTNYIGMDLHLYLLRLCSPIFTTVPTAPK